VVGFLAFPNRELRSTYTLIPASGNTDDRLILERDGQTDAFVRQ
jgi:hypothetical protein